MTTDLYIQQNETETFKKGDEVVMVRCYEATLKTNKGRVYTCKTDSFKSKSGDEVVFLEGIGGFFAAKFLEKINMQTTKKITFEDKGQDFLTWVINSDGSVVDCRPFQFSIWPKVIVTNYNEL